VKAGVAGFLHGRFEDELGEGLSRSLTESNTFVIPNLGLSLLRRMTIAEDPLLIETLPLSHFVSARQQSVCED
jgi:hypothetical protein